MMVIGITGGSGAGKSTLLKELENKGACVIDCDKVYHDLIESSEKMNDALKAEFPDAYESGRLDTKILGRMVYGNEEKLRLLESITHPCVIEETERIIRQAEEDGKTAAAIDAFGLHSSGMDRICDVTIAVTAPAESRINRIMLRDNISREYAEKRILSQKSDEQYAAECDLVLINDCESAEEFENKCKKFIENILEV